MSSPEEQPVPATGFDHISSILYQIEPGASHTFESFNFLCYCIVAQTSFSISLVNLCSNIHSSICVVYMHKGRYL